MSLWDVLYNIINSIPSVAISFLLVVTVIAGVVFVVGFSRHGVDFIKHGFRQIALDSSLEKRFDELTEKMASKDDIGRLESRLDAKLDNEIGSLRAELQTIKVNHFGHLKDFLGELTSILLDKNIINNENKARLDNHLRGM